MSYVLFGGLRLLCRSAYIAPALDGAEARLEIAGALSHGSNISVSVADRRTLLHVVPSPREEATIAGRPGGLYLSAPAQDG